LILFSAFTFCGISAKAQDSTANKDYKMFYSKPVNGDDIPTSNYSNGDYTAAFISDKNPGFSCLLSLSFPGLGQLYNEEIGMGFIHMGVGIGSLALLIAERDNDGSERGIGSLLFVVNYLWSAIDAPITSNKINKESRKQKLRLLEKGKILNFSTNSGSTFSIDPYAANAPLGIGLTYTF
jgi:hypothetical protein